METFETAFVFRTVDMVHGPHIKCISVYKSLLLVILRNVSFRTPTHFVVVDECENETSFLNECPAMLCLHLGVEGVSLADVGVACVIGMVTLFGMERNGSHYENGSAILMRGTAFCFSFLFSDRLRGCVVKIDDIRRWRWACRCVFLRSTDTHGTGAFYPVLAGTMQLLFLN